MSETHDSQCEAEFIEGPMAWTPCGCDRRAASLGAPPPPLHNLLVCASPGWRSWRDCPPACPHRRWAEKHHPDRDPGPTRESDRG